MHDSGDKEDKSPASAPEAGEAVTKGDEQGRAGEGGHMSSMRGRVMHVPGAALSFVAVLEHHDSECTKRSFATMREAEAFIKRNTPPPGRALSALYDRPASDD
jgi:hypothetical protein